MLRPVRFGILVLTLLCACSKVSSPTKPGGGGGNNSPAVNVNTTTIHLTYGATATISVIASDPDGDQLTFSYSAVGGTVASSGPTATSATFTAGSQWGPCSVTVTASDGKGGSTQAVATMYVQNPSAPSLCFSKGGPCTVKYRLSVTPREAVVVTQIVAGNRTDNNCVMFINYTGAGLPLGANVPHEFTDLGCLECSSSQNAMNADWDIDVTGHRAEPDGGTFHIHYTYFPSLTTTQCSP